MNSPKNNSRIKKIVKDAKDQVSITMTTLLKNGNTKVFRNNDFSEKIEIVLPENVDDLHDNIDKALVEVSDNTPLITTSRTNYNLYKQKVGSLKIYLD